MMKILLSMTLLILCSFFDTFAYLPTVYKGHFYAYSYDSGLGSLNHTYLLLDCDTFFNGHNYLKILSMPFQNTSEYLGYVREDTTAGKVYFIEKDSTQEVLVFDYALQVNNAFVYSYGLGNKTVHVDSVQMKYLFGQSRKVIYFDSIPAFVEGLGSARYGIVSAPSSNFLVLNQLDTSYSISAACQVLTLSAYEKSNTQIYPNPATNFLYLETTGGLSKNYNYKILNTMGQVCASGTLRQNQIDIRALSHASYVLLVPELNIVYKFMKSL